MEIPGWVFEAIKAYSGLDASLLSGGALVQAVGRRVARLSLPDSSAYWPLLREGGAELNSLVQTLTNKETYFFREPRQFEVLRDRVLPELLANRRREGAGVDLRLWSAGCATGEEAYSLAMTLADSQYTTGVPFEATIVGTDIDATALEYARLGCYGERAVRLVPDALRQRYLTRRGDRWCVVPEVARLVTFRMHNLASPCLPSDLAPEVLGGVDVIFCRNVTIYFDEPMRERLNACLAGLLREGGYLFVASAETLGHDRGRLSLVSLGDGFAFRKTPAVAEEQSQVPERGIRRPLRPARAGSVASAHARTRLPASPIRLGTVAAPKISPASPAPRVPRRQDHPALEAARRAFQEQAYDAGLHHLDLLSPLDAAQPEASCLHAAILLQQGKPDDANQICRRVLDGNPWHPDAYLLLGLGYRQQGRDVEAVSTLKQAIYLRPDDPQAHFFLGDTYRMLGLPAEARREYENTLNILDRKGARSSRVSLAGISDDLMRRACHTHLARSRQRKEQSR
ncbi:MAG: tetratricopeptide repeat protein [Anaerolineae bacterium]|nr:tetratricopeptide repeat protein [Anaerolineae bacterium]